MGVLNTESQERIIHAINLAENATSGEIRVAIEKYCKTDPLDRAAYFFEKLKMHKTAQRNGVLIYVAVEDHQFAILGDEGIHKRVSINFWDETKQLMLAHFKERQIADGLVSGIKHVGNQLKNFFPTATDDVNELPNEIFFGE